jgi:hypothetical protein
VVVARASPAEIAETFCGTAKSTYDEGSSSGGLWERRETSAPGETGACDRPLNGALTTSRRRASAGYAGERRARLCLELVEPRLGTLPEALSALARSSVDFTVVRLAVSRSAFFSRASIRSAPRPP